MKKQKFYVVWNGRNKGIYDNWAECKLQIEGFPNAIYKSFKSKDIAIEAFANDSQQYVGKDISNKEIRKDDLKIIGLPEYESISVDGAWNTNTGDMEYQGVNTKSKKVLFKQGPYYDGTNNVAEFLAIVHALGYCKKNKLEIPIYSDSRTALSWIKKKKAKTKLIRTERNGILFDLIGRAETWLKVNEFNNKILKWETQTWGENPADFGRK